LHMLLYHLILMLLLLIHNLLGHGPSWIESLSEVIDNFRICSIIIYVIYAKVLLIASRNSSGSALFSTISWSS
jgi:hypothetical protein